MAESQAVQVSCSRCGGNLVVSKAEYQRQSGQVYCEDCLVPFQCDSCGKQKQTIPEKVSQNKSLTCSDCVQSRQNDQSGLTVNNRVNSAQCAICDQQKDDLVEFQQAPGEPVCTDCIPTAREAIRESQSGIMSVVSRGIGYLTGMVVYSLGSLGVSLYLVSTYNLVWWMFFLLSGIFLLAGAHWSEIFEPSELVDLGYATVMMSAAVWLAFGGRNFEFATLLGSIAISGLIVHELSHKAIGLGFGKPARFSAFYTLNMISVGLVYATGLLFLFPGAVNDQAVTDRVHGIVAAAGPISNILLAIGFLGISGSYPEIALIGVIVNTALAGFNMLPIPPFDGSHVWRWSVGVYLLIAGFIGAFGYQLFTTLA